MDASSGLVPWLLSGGAVGLLGFVLRWGRQDSKDAVEMATLNATAAGEQRDAAVEEAKNLRVELRETRAELTTARREADRLRRLLERHHIDPDAEAA